MPLLRRGNKKENAMITSTLTMMTGSRIVFILQDVEIRQFSGEIVVSS